MIICRLLSTDPHSLHTGWLLIIKLPLEVYSSALCAGATIVGRAERIGSYRFLHNESVTEEILIEEQKQRCKQQAKDRPVLCIHDTTEAIFFNHSNRLTHIAANLS